MALCYPACSGLKRRPLAPNAGYLITKFPCSGCSKGASSGKALGTCFLRVKSCVRIKTNSLGFVSAGLLVQDMLSCMEE